MAKTKGSNRATKVRSVSIQTCNFSVQNKRGTQKARIKRVSWRDEQFEGMSVQDVPELTDPAILVVKESITIRYSKDELIKLRDVPLSKKKPEFFEALEVPLSILAILDPERWPFVRKKSSDNSENAPSAEHRCRPRGDPRERIRKENDGIVLSPQRRSFKSGCFVLARCDTAGNNNRPHSPLGGKAETSHIGIREVQPNARRIGSGRIIRDTWDFNDKSEIGDSDNYSGFRSQRSNSSNVDEKYERRSFGRDFEINRDRDRENNNKDTRRNGGRFERRRISENRDIEEPEWFSGGPASQNDTIELRGFDDEKPRKKKPSPSRIKRAKEWSKKKETQQNPEDREDSKEPTDRSTPTLQADVESSDGDVSKQTEQEKKTVEDKQEGPNTNNNTTSTTEETKVSSIIGDQSFNFDDILKCDTFPGLLTNGVGGDGDNAKSRFSRWFKQESPEKQDSRRSSIHDENNIIKGLLSDITETSITIPGDSDAYFAPISPANNNLGGVIGNKTITSQPKQQGQPINIMEMLQRSNQRLDRENVKQQPPVIGKILSLDELEAKIRHNTDVNSGVNQKAPQKPDEEMTAAFKKLLAQAQAAGGHSTTSNGPVNKPQPMSLLEMLNHSQQQDEAARLSAAAAAHMLGPISPNVLHHHPAHIANELSMKLQQAQLQQQQQKQQMEMLNKLINATTAAHQIHVDVGMQQQSRDLLNRPEAQAILQAMHQRIPSPRELQVHTQNILQRALIKKKLEEQQENYRKKQEMQRGQSPNTNNTQNPTKSVASPTPLAFTPTSVLRKMTADKDESKENKATIDNKIPPGRPVTGIRPQPPQPQVNTQWNAQFGSVKQPAGRPIVKANNYQTQTPEQFFSQHQQQQRLFNAVQPVISASQQQQQRKSSTVSQFGNTVQPSVSGGQYNQPQYPSTNQQFGQQLTHQQLRAQHQHRPTNQGQQTQPQSQQQQSQQNMGAWQQLFGNAQQRANRSINNPLARSLNEGGTLSPTTTNQLAQWFSPDLLERARGGELPSTAGLAQHVLSLEEIERQTAPPVHN